MLKSESPVEYLQIDLIFIEGGTPFMSLFLSSVNQAWNCLQGQIFSVDLCQFVTLMSCNQKIKQPIIVN